MGALDNSVFLIFYSLFFLVPCHNSDSQAGIKERLNCSVFPVFDHERLFFLSNRKQVKDVICEMQTHIHAHIHALLTEEQV